MLLFILTMNWIFSIIFMQLNHPLALGCILLIQTILLSLSSGFMYFNFWFSYILFLIMIGGMLVMFLYMTSIASNEKFSMPKNKIMIMSPLIPIILLFMDKFYSNLINLSSINLNFNNLPSNLSLTKFFNFPNMTMLIILMIYLLATLIATVKITGKNFGTLRQK
uniref:NADH-ubiquinone oxidoreductase chain 6 n=1 Tax=Curculionoidea sp. 15 KM-2017 TaxID=2219398 RepID=A0A346RG49_9CUCU|nr:NADH dehydrogenase subunit 6 [Curculionoidea sp. 15 KM-2017]